MKNVSGESVNDFDHGAVSRDENVLAVQAELETGPFGGGAGLFADLEVREGAFLKRTQVVEFDGVRADASCEDEAFRVEVGHWPTCQVHHS